MDGFTEMPPETFRRRMKNIGYKVKKHGDDYDLIDPNTGNLVLINATQEQAVNWAAEKFFGFTPKM